MAYNSYGNSGYGQAGNPFHDQTPYDSYDNRPAPPYPGGAPTTYAYGQDVEMGSMESRPPVNNPQTILDETRRVEEGVTEVEQILERVQIAQRKALNDASGGNSPSSREVESLTTNFMTSYKALLNRMGQIKKKPQSGDPRCSKHIGRVERMLRETMQKYQRIESDYQTRMREQIARQYRITKPEATEEEVRQACEDPNQQVFTQALMRSDRRGESRQVLSAVRDRHEAIAKIERQMVELAELFQQMEQMVVEQEPLVGHIEKQAEETNDHIVAGNEHLTKGVSSARAARKKKWICLAICVALIIIIIIIVLAVLAANGDFKGHSNNNSSQ